MPEAPGTGDRLFQRRQQAKELLEENKRLALQKREAERVQDRMEEGYETERLERNRALTERERAKEAKSREKTKNLAMGYLAKMEEDEDARRKAYLGKVGSGNDYANFFPFVEGEGVDKAREQQQAERREDLRRHLEAERAANPPRIQIGAVGMHTTPRHQYRFSSQEDPSAAMGEPNTDLPLGNGLPKFLGRAKEHVSRRLVDHHVRQTMQSKAELVKAQLVMEGRRRYDQMEANANGLHLNDALRYDLKLKKATEQQLHKHAVKGQIEERRERRQLDRKEALAEKTGYWGPEDRGKPPLKVFLQNQSALREQMEVDRCRVEERRQAARNDATRMEECALMEMAKDRAKDMAKRRIQREALCSTWGQQVAILQTNERVQAIGS